MESPFSQLERAIHLLANDEIVGIPTETVYGLAGNAYSERAIKKIFELKKRPLYNPLIVHINGIDFLDKVAMEIPQKAFKLFEVFSPGPLTVVLKKKAVIPDIVSAGKPTVGIRIPNHPITLSLLEMLEFPLAAPSANPFASISPTTAEHVKTYFKDQLPLVLNGGSCKRGIESTIIGFENNQAILYRHGSIVVEEIESVIGAVKTVTKNETSPEAPGMLSKHYAPKTRLVLTDTVESLIDRNAEKRIGLLLFNEPIDDSSIVHTEILSASGNLKEAASQLYAALHRLDNLELDLIIAKRFPDTGLGKSINDRLERGTR